MLATRLIKRKHTIRTFSTNILRIALIVIIDRVFFGGGIAIRRIRRRRGAYVLFRSRLQKAYALYSGSRRHFTIKNQYRNRKKRKEKFRNRREAYKPFIFRKRIYYN